MPFTRTIKTKQYLTPGSTEPGRPGIAILQRDKKEGGDRGGTKKDDAERGTRVEEVPRERGGKGSG